MNKKSRQKGFTLIEILVATAIFATVMIIVVATFSWAAGYNNRLKETRRVGQEVRAAMDQLTTDIRTANGSGTVAINSVSYPIGEVTFLLCSKAALAANSTCRPRFQATAAKYKNNLAATTNPIGTDPISDAVLILKKDSNPPEAILYRSVIVDARNRKFTMSVFQKNDLDFNALDLTRDFPAASTVALHPISPENNPMSMQVYFGGYGATKSSRTQQPYAEIYIIGSTYNFDLVQPNMRSMFHLRTTVETRDYNP